MPLWLIAPLRQNASLNPQKLVPATTINAYDSGLLETILVHAWASDDEFTTEGYGANHGEVMWKEFAVERK